MRTYYLSLAAMRQAGHVNSRGTNMPVCHGYGCLWKLAWCAVARRAAATEWHDGVDATCAAEWMLRLSLTWEGISSAWHDDDRMPEARRGTMSSSPASRVSTFCLDYSQIFEWGIDAPQCIEEDPKPNPIRRLNMNRSIDAPQWWPPVVPSRTNLWSLCEYFFLVRLSRNFAPLA